MKHRRICHPCNSIRDMWFDEMNVSSVSNAMISSTLMCSHYVHIHNIHLKHIVIADSFSLMVLNLIEIKK